VSPVKFLFYHSSTVLKVPAVGPFRNLTLKINFSATEIRYVLSLRHVLYTVVNEPDVPIFRSEEMKNNIHIPFCPDK
jgi:hypothetical protein